MSRFGGLSEERPSVFKTRSKLGTHLSTQCSGDERQSRPCAAVNRTPDLWCLGSSNSGYFFENYISRYGVPVKLISVNGPQFISDIFEYLSDRSGIRHVKTVCVVYRTHANRTDRVNRDLVQMIANNVNDQHDTRDQSLREFAYALRTAMNETTGKTPAELFLGRKLITRFQKLVMVSDGTEFSIGDIERLFEEARRNTKAKHEK
ncbi:retrovirus-related Pol polyprotein from transposon 297 [Trichonephila clavipes]|nr:retrovirus-related Pol polyprotein from transposon 297 [Trichonephila clavipes]